MYKLVHLYLVNICIMTLAILKVYFPLYNYIPLSMLVLNVK